MYATRIVGDLQSFGLPVEVVPGWETRGNETFDPKAVVCHWTAGPRGSTSRPSLNVVVHGRVGLPGPLCNVYFDRRGICVVVAAGKANHAGAGGYRGLSGNASVYGIEAEAAGDGDWTPEQRTNYPILVAALLHGIGRDESWACGHNEWAPTRKIDIRDWDMPAMRTQVAAALKGAAVPVAPAPPLSAPGGSGLPVTGAFDAATKRALQRRIGVKSDGIVGPVTRRALQRFLGVRADGIWGPVTVRALQRLAGARQDGSWGPETTRALQRYLNRLGAAL